MQFSIGPCGPCFFTASSFPVCILSVPLIHLLCISYTLLDGFEETHQLGTGNDISQHFDDSDFNFFDDLQCLCRDSFVTCHLHLHEIRLLHMSFGIIELHIELCATGGNKTKTQLLVLSLPLDQ